MPALQLKKLSLIVVLLKRLFRQEGAVPEFYYREGQYPEQVGQPAVLGLPTCNLRPCAACIMVPLQAGPFSSACARPEFAS